MLRAALLALIVACHNSPPPTPTPPPNSGSSGDNAGGGTTGGSTAGSGSSEGGTTQGGGTQGGTQGSPTGPGIAQKCGDNDACAAGLECVHYRGIAGAAGPEFKTCEKRCDGKVACPEGRKCATIADGPGRVCR